MTMKPHVCVGVHSRDGKRFIKPANITAGNCLACSKQIWITHPSDNICTECYLKQLDNAIGNLMTNGMIKELVKENKIPDTADAQKWLDTDTFIFQGKVYAVDFRGVIRYMVGVQG